MFQIYGADVSEHGGTIYRKLPGVHVTKLFAVVIIEILLSARVFVLGRPFQFTLMLASKAVADPSAASFSFFTLG